MYVNPSSLTLKLMERWAAKLGGSKFVDDAAALNELLLDPEFHPHLTLGIFASALFPTSAEITGKQQSAQLKVRILTLAVGAGPAVMWTSEDLVILSNMQEQTIAGTAQLLPHALCPGPGGRMGNTSQEWKTCKVSSSISIKKNVFRS